MHSPHDADLASRLDALQVERVRADHAVGLAKLFGEADAPCFCRYWHFEGDKNAWQDRCANAPEQNEREMHHRLTTADAELGVEMHGFVALLEDRVVGWMKLSQAKSMAKFYGQRLYRGLPCFTGDREGVYMVGCFLVREETRRRGVGGALLDAAIEWAKVNRVRALEAFPRRDDHAHDADLYLGPFSLFARRGFEVVNDFGPYPVLRLELATH